MLWFPFEMGSLHAGMSKHHLNKSSRWHSCSNQRFKITSCGYYIPSLSNHYLITFPLNSHYLAIKPHLVGGWATPLKNMSQLG